MRQSSHRQATLEDAGPKANFVAGSWRVGSDALRNDNPSDLDEPIGEFARASHNDVGDAVATAEAAFGTWSRTNPKRRSEALDTIGSELLARSEELDELLSREEGKTLAEGVGEARRAGEIIRCLVAGIVTRSLAHATHFRLHAEAGMVMVNLPTAGMDYHAPFGGVKASNYGPREQGTYAKEFFTYTRASYVLAGDVIS